MIFAAGGSVVTLCFLNVVTEIDAEGLVTYPIDPNYHLYVKVAYVVFTFVWTIFFVLGCQKVMLSDVFGSWYFDNKASLAAYCYKCFCPTAKPIYRLVRYNLGSVAFGSLFVSISKIFRLLAYIFGREMKKKGLV